MARRQTAANPLAGLVGEAVLQGLLGNLVGQPQPAAKREFKGAIPGMRSVAVISATEIEALAAAVKSGKNVEVTDENGRRTVVEVLSDEDAKQFRGKFRIHRALPAKA